MPKRKHESEFDYLAKKLKKLERKIKHRRQRQISSSDSEGDYTSLRNQQESEIISIAGDDVADPQGTHSYWDDNMNPEHDFEMEVHPVDNMSNAEPQPTTSDIPSSLPSITPAATAEEKGSDNLSSLDPDILEIMGEDPTSVKEYGPEIQKDLAIRLAHIVTSGLNKDNRKELKEKYLIPSNCKLLKAPSLNPEIRASLQESQAKRDKGIENKQSMTSCALSSLCSAITILLSSGYKNQELLKALMDTARTLGDIQHGDSVLRRYFILSTVKKELKDQLEKTTIDETLFGTNLPETLKSAKTISKSGADIRSASSFKPNPPKPSRPTSRPLNYRAPPAPRRQGAPVGTRNSRPPAPPVSTPRQTSSTMPHHSSYRTSWRQQQPRHRR